MACHSPMGCTQLITASFHAFVRFPYRMIIFHYFSLEFSHLHMCHCINVSRGFLVWNLIQIELNFMTRFFCLRYVKLEYIVSFTLCNYCIVFYCVRHHSLLTPVTTNRSVGQYLIVVVPISILTRTDRVSFWYSHLPPSIWYCLTSK